MAVKQTEHKDALISGEEGKDLLVGQAASALEVTAPAGGETKTISLEKGQTATLNFDATVATPVLEGNDFVLTFDSNGDGSADSRIVFQNLVENAQGADAPVLVIGGIELSSSLLIGQAQALAEGETLETAAGAGAGPQGGGGSIYDDDLGDVDLDGLSAQGGLAGSLSGLAELVIAASAETLINFPTIDAANETVILDDDDVSGLQGNNGGVGDDTPINVAGTLSHNYGGDGAGSLLLLATGAPAGFVYELSAGGTALTVTQDGTAVLSVTLADTTSGNYSITQLAAIAHPEGEDENNIEFVFNYRVTDATGDSVDGTLSLSVDDDTPVTGDDTLEVTDENAGNIVTGTLLDNGDSFGADGAGVVREVTHDGVTFTLANDGQSVVSSEPSDYSFDAVTGILTVSTTADATFTVDMAGENLGDYSYEGPADHPGEDFALGGGSYNGNTYTQANPATGVIVTLTGAGDLISDGSPVDVILTGSEFGGIGISNVNQGTGDATSIDDGGVMESITVSLSDAGGAISSDYLAITLGSISDSDPNDVVNWTVEAPGGPFTGTTVQGQTVLELEIPGMTSVTLSPTGFGNGFTVEAVSTAADTMNEVFDYTIEDADGDQASAKLTVAVTDDNPTADIALLNGVEIDLDETENDGDDTENDGLLADVTVSAADLFVNSSIFGADGEAASGATEYALNLTDRHPVDSGLVDAITNEEVILTLEAGGDIVGSSTTGGEVFRVSVDADTGDVTVTQSRVLEHDDTDHDEADTPEIMNSGILNLIVTVTDADGDQSADSVDLGSVIQFEDDGPSISDDYAGRIKEKRLDDNDPDNTTLTGKMDVDFGSDGGSVTGIEFKGWTDSEDLDPSGITLYSGGVVVIFTSAVVASELVYTGSAAGQDVIKIVIDQATGDYTVTQLGPVDHPDVSYDSEHDAIPDGQSHSNDYDPIDLRFEVTVTDGDGDTDTADLTVRIEDDEVDSRSVFADENVFIDETTLVDGIDDNSFISGTLELGLGADGGSVTDIWFDSWEDSEDGRPDGEILQSGGQDVIFGAVTDDGNGNLVLVGKVGVQEIVVVTINKTSGDYTIELKGPIDHPDNGGNHDPVTLSFRYETIDGDGDQDISALEIIIEDDVPSVVDASNSTDESSLPSAWAIATGTIVADFGADGGEFTAISLEDFTDAAGNPIDLADLSSGGNPITVHQTVSTDGKSLVLVGYADGKAVFDVYLNKETGDYAYRQYGGGLDHKGDKGIGDALKLVFGYEVTDGDGDTDNGQLTIEVSDSETVAILDEDHSFNGERIAGNVLDNDTVGADGASVISYTYEGKTYDISGALIIKDVGQFYLKPDGSYKFYPEGNPDQNKQVEFGYTIKDGDGDEASAKLVIDIEDAVPTAGDEYAGHIRESDIAAGTAKQSGTLEGDFGADGAGTFAISDLELVVDVDYGNGASVDLTSGGEVITFGSPVEVNGLMVITGVAAIGDNGEDEDVLTLSINPATGRYEIILLRPIDHPDAARTDISDQVELTFRVVLTDADGTTAEGSLRFRVSDDNPEAVVDENVAIAAGEGLGEAKGNVLDNDLAGADGGVWVNSVTFDGTEITLSKENTSQQSIAGTYGMLYITSEGRYYYEPFEDAGIRPNGPIIEDFSYTITDNDGDVSAPVNLSIEVKGLVTASTELYEASGWNAPGEKSVAVDTAAHKTVTVRDFVEASVDYSAHKDEEIILSVQNAKRGDITLGDKDDILVVTNSANGAGSSTYPAEFNIDAGEGNDTVLINKGEVRSGAPHTTNATIVDGSLTNTNVDLGDGNDIFVNNTKARDIVRGGTGDDDINTGSGNDIVYGDEGDDVIDGGSDNDIIFGGDDNDILEGGNGNDILYGDDGDDTLSGGNHKDILRGGEGADELSGGNDDDILIGGIGNDILEGGNGHDILRGDEGDDVLEGGNDNDLLYGGDNNDTLEGGNDNDTLHGGTGNDVLAGGNDADIFIFSLKGTGVNDIFGQDVVTDFNASEDVLRFTDVVDSGAGGLDLADLNAMISNVTDNGENGTVVVDFHNGSSITFNNMGTAGGMIDSIDDLVNNPASQIIID
ncbi:hypothetical protein WH96_03195 [Kiloniella spongiae]|uniref:DUF5801 domain-containing protein n=1 Tax=Kiloniella spongiae TaxID=1489064 RepID=A0A0H2MP16_9PROT|nr:DUF5801 repeats-in-toxin domain-containing protein [Kiloniella spongiae]KLN62507.1 hypothetical protein WH96_03195 [Kiloniella spongiae]